MRYNKYAMPVHPKVLEQDFENTVDLSTLNEIYLILREGKNIPFLEIGNYIQNAWFYINERYGINLRNREKLVPVFYELNEIVKGRKQANKAYRGVRLSNFDPNALTRTYPNSINDPEVLEHLEGLAYGLRSWSDSKTSALNFALDKPRAKKDAILFEIENPSIILDMNEAVKFYSSLKMDVFIGDYGEVVLNVKNPKIVDIEKNSAGLYMVRIEDMG